MDIWKFYDITHREHVICNPTSEEKLTRLVELLRLPTDSQVVDIACGKGEFLIRLAEAYRVRGAGIDISPFHIADAKRQACDAGIGRGHHFHPDEWCGLQTRRAAQPGPGVMYRSQLDLRGARRYSRRADRHGEARRLGDRGRAILAAGAVRGLPGGIRGCERGLREPLFECGMRRAARIGPRSHHREQPGRLGQIRRPAVVRDQRVRSQPSGRSGPGGVGRASGQGKGGIPALGARHDWLGDLHVQTAPWILINTGFQK